MPTPNTFPELVPDGYAWTPQSFQTRIDLANGEQQIHEPYPGIQRVFEFEYSMLERAEMWQQLMPHFYANKARPFTLFDFWEIPWVDEPFATGDGSSAVFYLPAKAVEGLTVYVNANATPVTLAPGLGAEGEDRITFASAPPAGARLAFSCSSSRRRFTVTYFAGPNTPPQLQPVPLEGGLWGARFQLIERIKRS